MNIMKNKIGILLSTFNGQKYLREQLTSIVNQTNKDWKLFIRDDGSTDDTIKIIYEFENRYDNIHLITDNMGNVRPLRSFRSLVGYAAKFDYIMFCDQDDIWYRNKVDLSILKIKELENTHKYALAYTNYIVRNNDIDTIAYSHDMSELNTPNRILVQSWLMGCTMIMNSEMAVLAQKIPESAENHDNWYAKIASMVTEIGYISEPTMIHRLHNNNVTGRENTGHKKVQLYSLFELVKNRKKEFYKQYETFLEITSLVSKIPSRKKHIEVLKAYGTLFTRKNKFSKISLIRKFHFAAFNINQNIKFLIVILFNQITSESL